MKDDPIHLTAEAYGDIAAAVRETVLSGPAAESVSATGSDKDGRKRKVPDQLSPGSRCSSTRKGGELHRSALRDGSWAALTSQTEAVLGVVALVMAAMITGRQIICMASTGVGAGVVAGPEGEDLTAENSSFYY
jgi:hypothetical protein